MTAAAIGSGTHLNRALKDFQHNCQHIFLERFQKSSGVLVGLSAVAGCFGVGCLDTEYFCTEYFVAGCVVAGCFCTEYFVAACFCAEYVFAERSDSDLLVESIAIVRELD